MPLVIFDISNKKKIWVSKLIYFNSSPGSNYWGLVILGLMDCKSVRLIADFNLTCHFYHLSFCMNISRVRWYFQLRTPTTWWPDLGPVTWDVPTRDIVSLNKKPSFLFNRYFHIMVIFYSRLSWVRLKKNKMAAIGQSGDPNLQVKFTVKRMNLVIFSWNIPHLKKYWPFSWGVGSNWDLLNLGSNPRSVVKWRTVTLNVRKLSNLLKFLWCMWCS